MLHDTSKKPKILLTGGHLSPLLAVLEELLKSADCVVVGRKYPFEGDKTESLEYKILEETGVPFYNLNSGRLQRKLSKRSIPSLLKSPGAIFFARKIIEKEKPDAILTFGGYVGLPVALAAFSKGVPIILHEQTMFAGLTNRVIGKIATLICISFPSSSPFFPAHKTVLTGNPIRKEVFKVQKAIDIHPGKPMLFVTGGSTGAHAINSYVELLLPKLLEHFVVIHQTGDSQTFTDYERLRNTWSRLDQSLQKSYIVRKFIMPSEIGWVYKNADVVLARAGANTVSELLALQKKALLIPLPHGQHEEQLVNAKFYEESSLGTYMEQKDVQLSDLLQVLLMLEKRTVKEANGKGRENSAEKIVQEVLRVVSHEA